MASSARSGARTDRVSYVRYLDSALGPIIFGLAPAFLLSGLTALSPKYKAWSNTWTGALLSAGFYLLVVAVGYHLYGDDPERLAAEERRWAGRLPSFLFPMDVSTITSSGTQTRQESAYRPYIGVDIDALEAGELELPDRLFNYCGWRFTSILSIRNRDHLALGDEGLRVKLDRLLRSEGVTETMGKVWLFTVPSILGWTAFRLFSLWFVYGSEGELKVVVLEIHDASGHPHTYFLPTSTSVPSDQYTHSFAFPHAATPSSTLKLEIMDPFPHGPEPTTIPCLIMSLTLTTPSNHITTRISPSTMHQAKPAPLRISQTGAVWLVLLYWIWSVVPAHIRERGVLNTMSEWGDQLWHWADQLVRWTGDTIVDAGRWTLRGQGGMHTQ